MTDPTSLPNFTPQAPTPTPNGAPTSDTPVRDRIIGILKGLEIDATVDDDGDIEFAIVDDKGISTTLFARIAEGDLALVRFFGQWQLAEPVSADRNERLARCNDMTMQLNIVKMTLVQESLVVSAEHVVTPNADLDILVPLSINHILQSVGFFFQSWLPAEGEPGSDGAGLMGEFVRLEVDGGIGTIRLDRPKMNALNVQVQEEIRAAAQEATARADVKAVIVYGGERVFAAGADIKEMQAMSYTDMVERSGPLMSSISAVARIPKPVIAAITGYALGGGCELALACDFRVVADDAKLGQPEILLGIIPGAGGTQRLSRLVGASRAKEIIFSGRFVDAQEALAIGLADRVVPAADVYTTSREWASTFVGAASYAVRAAKEAIDRGLEVDLETGLEIERLLFASLFATTDREIGMTSFVEHGPGKAQFEGR